VRIELWSDEPPASQEEREITQEATFTVSVFGRLELTALFGMPSDASAIRLPRLGSYRVRAHLKGWAEAGEHGEAEFFHDVEHWLLQIWPRDPNRAPRENDGEE
jgi:hypothetical protein